ncbi:hypothetical protein Fcan01_00271 [Folsomia candida]|uniref:Gustatory receptor n=1 Tax=Folsomia candida TaxID=158441 RepID=A0A226F203_FOLCA|nr:hypothetical protein Fcan01_00271 [Folsomia candida]
MAHATFFLSILQFLGYVPISFSKLETYPQKRGKISKLFSICLKFFPGLCYSLLSFSVVITFLYRYAYCPPSEILVILKSRGTFYFVLIFKCFTHLYFSSFIKLDMLVQHRKLGRFWKNFFNLTFQVSGGNRYYKRFMIEFCLFFGIIGYWSLEMYYFMHTKVGNDYEFAFLMVTPVVVGYYHSTFSFLQVYVLIWYLEILKRIQIEARRNRGRGKDAGNKPILHPYFDTDNEETLLETSSTSLIDLYSQVEVQVKDFSKLFGCWITMDIGHSVLRIIFSGYFIASLLGKKEPMLMQVVQNFLTVMVYFYLVVMVAKRGSELRAKSDEIVNDLDASVRREGLNGGGELKLRGIRVKTKFMVLDLGIVIPIVATITTNLLVLIQFHSSTYNNGNCDCGNSTHFGY